MLIDETKIIEVGQADKNNDPHVPVIDLRSGIISEYRLGPHSAAFQSGDRPAVWEPQGRKAIIRARYTRTHMFYKDFCVHPEALKLASKKTGKKFSEADGMKYFDEYVSFMAKRGHGHKANTSTPRPNYHPAITRKIRSASRHVAEAKAESNASGELLAVLTELVAKVGAKGG